MKKGISKSRTGAEPLFWKPSTTGKKTHPQNEDWKQKYNSQSAHEISDESVENEEIIDARRLLKIDPTTEKGDSQSVYHSDGFSIVVALAFFWKWDRINLDCLTDRMIEQLVVHI